MIDLRKAQGLHHWAKVLAPGRNGAPVSVSTLVRWILNGLIAPDGSRVYLEATRLGHRWLTDEDAIQKFAERLTPISGASCSRQSPAARRHADERADRDLARRGL